MAGSALQTELDIQTRGAADAVNQLNNVANAARNLEGAGEAGGKGFTHMARGVGMMAGANREAFMLISGLTDAIESAEGSWSKFAGAVGDTAVFAGAAIGIASVIDKAKELSQETDKIRGSAGLKGRGFFGNLSEGFQGLFGIDSAGDLETRERGAGRTRLTDAQRAGLRGEFAEREIRGIQRDSSPEEKAATETKQWAASLTGVAATAEEIASHYADSLQHEKDIVMEAKNRTEEFRKQQALQQSILDRAEKSRESGRHSDLAAEQAAASMLATGKEVSPQQLAALEGAADRARDQAHDQMQREEEHNAALRRFYGEGPHLLGVEQRGSAEAQKDIADYRYSISGQASRNIAAAGAGAKTEEEKRTYLNELMLKAMQQLTQGVTFKGLSVVNLN